MAYYLIKLFLSAGIIVAVSEVAKFNVGLGALIKSLPLISITGVRRIKGRIKRSVCSMRLCAAALSMRFIRSGILS